MRKRKLSRRDMLKGASALAAGLASPSIVRAQELRKVRMGFGIKSVNPIVINVLIGEGLGYIRLLRCAPDCRKQGRPPEQLPRRAPRPRD